MTKYESDIRLPLWSFGLVHGLIIITGLIQQSDLQYLFYDILPEVFITMCFLTYVIMYVRNYDIYIFKTGIGVKNKWRFFGQRKWKYKFAEIESVEFRIPIGSRNMADFYIWIGKKRFNLLMRKEYIFDIIKTLEEYDVKIILDSKTRKYLNQNGININQFHI